MAGIGRQHRCHRRSHPTSRDRPNGAADVHDPLPPSCRRCGAFATHEMMAETARTGMWTCGFCGGRAKAADAHVPTSSVVEYILRPPPVVEDNADTAVRVPCRGAVWCCGR